MSDFLIHAARMQDAGVLELTVRLGLDRERTRIMFVKPGPRSGPWAATKFPERRFDLCGTDRVLERLKDNMFYSEDGATPEKVQTAIDAHPIAADDLREWFADYLLAKMPTDAELAAVEVSAEEVARSNHYLKGLLRGINVVESRKAMRAHGGPSHD